MMINFSIIFILLSLISCEISDKKVETEWFLIGLKHQLIEEASNLAEEVDYQIFPEIICGIRVKNVSQDTVQMIKGTNLNYGEYFLIFNNQEKLDSIKLYSRSREQIIQIPPDTTVEFFMSTKPNDLKNINIDDFNGLSLQGLRMIARNTKSVKFIPGVPDSKQTLIELYEIYKSQDFVQKLE